MASAPPHAVSHAYPPWAAPLGVGVVLRLVAALTGFGWFAPDDYNFVIAQSGHWLHNSAAPFNCTYRSTLLPRLFWLLSEAAQCMGLHGPTATLRFAYGVLGLASVAAIPAVYKLAARHSDALTARTAAWLMAVFFLMPRISTRPLLETAAVVPLAWGALWLDRMRDDNGGRRLSAAFWAAACLGTACLFRFQVGVVLPAVAMLWVLGPAAGRWRAAMGLGLGFWAVALAQAGIDLSEGRVPLSTPWAYLHYNLGNSSQYGESPWFTYLLHFLTFTLPPVTIALAAPFMRSLRCNVTVASLFVSFVVGHSFIGHKEDRFMFPILPLFFVLLAVALEAAAKRGGWRTLSVRIFWTANALALVVATCSDAQRNLTRPFLHIARQGGEPSIATVGLNLAPEYYLQGHGNVVMFDDVASLQRAVDGSGDRFDYVLLREPKDAAQISTSTPLVCGAPRLFFGDWLDRILVLVNRHNERRDATALLTCGESLANYVRSRP